MKFSSKYLENLVEQFSSLPSIGKRTALRLALHLVQDEFGKSEKIAQAMLDMKQNIKRCKCCNNLSDEELCDICKDSSRRKEVLCVVESIRDVMAIEETGQFSGYYHVLGGVISPMDGVGPGDLSIDMLVDRIRQDHIEELILAVSPTIEGDTTIFYISKLLSDVEVKMSTIARGVAFGGELEYADEITLGKSIVSRIPYEKHTLNS